MDYSNIRLIGLDLDGTLLHDDKALSDRTRLALQNAYKKGIEIVPITGRPLAGLPKSVTDMPEISYIIYSNGAQIIHNGESLYSFALPNSRAREIVKILRELGCMFEVFIEGWGYIEPNVDEHYHRAFSEDSPVGQYVFGSRRVVDSIDDLLDSGKDVDEIFIICQSVDNRQELMERTDAVSDIQKWCLGDVFFEITNKGTDKGEALAILCKHLGISLGDTIAFGDGENDLTFLDRAGIAVAMQNAPDVVKQRADIIAPANNDDGVAQIIEHMI